MHPPLRALAAATAVTLLLAVPFRPSLARAVPQRAERPAEARVVVPIRLRMMPGGVVRYSIPVTIGSTEVEAMLDTGSGGFRVLPGTITAADYIPTHDSSAISYGSGVQLHGIVGRAFVTLGGIRSAARVGIQVVTFVGCDHKRQNCPAVRMPQSEYRLGGSGSSGAGFRAIIGVNFSHGSVANPLPALGVTNWIIEVPTPGDHHNGQLILNPTAADLAGFALFHINANGKPHDGIQGCLSDVRMHKELCGPTMLDTGAPGVHATFARGSAQVRFRNGDPARFTFHEGRSSAPPLDFTVTASGATRVKLEPSTASGTTTALYAGIIPFAHYQVLYDNQNQEIGLKVR